MINLLPPTTKSDIAYARKNSLLLKYCSFMLLAIVGLALITGVGVMYMKQSGQALHKQAEESNRQLDAKNLTGVQKQAEDIASNIKLASDVLSRQILFSKLLRQIGAAMPANTSLSDLKINKDDLGISLTAVATNYNSASQVQVNLADPTNKIFKQADLISIDCNKPDRSRYPCTVAIRALFGDNQQFLLINPTKKGTS